MAFRATNQIPLDAYLILKRAAAQLTLNLEGFNVQLSESNSDYDLLRAIYQTLSRAEAQFEQLKATPGIGVFAVQQEDDPTYDVATEFNALLTAIAAAKVWIETNIPLSVSVKPVSSWDDGTMISTTFSTVETSGLRSVINSVIAEVV